MSEVQVHDIGTKVVIDHMAKTIGTQYPKDVAPREIYSLDEDWIKPYTLCRVCNKEVDDIQLAFAYWKHQQSVCSANCIAEETHKRYACCDKAVRTPCICTYSYKCPDHGETHIGTHD